MGKSSFNKGNGWVSSYNPVQLSFLCTPEQKKTRRTWKNVPHCGRRKLLFFSHAGIQFEVPAVSFPGCDYLDDVAQWRCLHLQAPPRSFVFCCWCKGRVVSSVRFARWMPKWMLGKEQMQIQSTAWLSGRKQISIVKSGSTTCAPNLAHSFLRFPKSLWNEFPK